MKTRNNITPYLLLFMTLVNLEVYAQIDIAPSPELPSPEDNNWVEADYGIKFKYGGGIYMTDTSWIRTYGNKNFYHNTGIMRTDGTFQVGSGGSRMLVKTDGKVGIGTTNPLEKLHINGSIRGHIGTGALRVQSGSGYIDVGAQNTSWAHIYTDRSKFIFNKDIFTISNGFSSYNDDLILRTKGSERLRINDETGNVGIGTTAPSYKLETRGDIYANGGWLRVAGSSGVFFQTHGGGFHMTDTSWIRTYGNKNFYHNTGVMRTDGTFQVGSGGSRMLVKTDGKVGIGTTSPDELLTVKGKIHAQEIIVDQEGPLADYVFETYYDGTSTLKPSYKVPSLSEVEDFTKAHKHLPGIPSASEVKNQGLSLGSMSNLLLEKIEELTLYTIEQEKELEQVRKENEALRVRLVEIEKHLNIETP